MWRRAGLGLRLQRPLLLAVALCCASFLLLACSADLSVSPGLSLDDSLYLPLELDSSLGGGGSVHSMAGLSTHSMTDRELFQQMQDATGLPQPPTPPRLLGLNLVAEQPCAIYVSRPTHLKGISIILNPDDPEAIKSLGDVDLTLNIKHGGVSFTTTEGVKFTGKSVNAVSTQMVGSLSALNNALSTLLFGPEEHFYGYAAIGWSLTSRGENPVPRTNGSITVVVGSMTLLPSLEPLAEDGVLADFAMNELSTSHEFEGVRINDGSQTAQTVYEISIQHFEGTLNILKEQGLTFSQRRTAAEGHVGRTVFTGLPSDVNKALESFTFSTSAYGEYNGAAGFIIVVTNTFHKTSGFIQGEIRNRPVGSKPVAGALAPPRVTEVAQSSAKVHWDALPVGFVESAKTPRPSGYLLEYAQSSEGPWSMGYSGENTQARLGGLQKARKYYLRVFTVNAGGQSPASPITSFTTLPSLPGAAQDLAVTHRTSNSVSLTWTPPADNGGGAISMYRIVSQPTHLVGTALGESTTVSFAPSVTVSALAAYTKHTFTVVCFNAAGASPAASIEGSTLGIAPVIVSYSARGPSTGENKYNNDVVLTIVFSINTNQPAVNSKAALDTIFKFNPSIGADYTGKWTNAHTLEIDIIDTGSASPVIGLATVAVKGGILAQNGNSAPTTCVSPALTGFYGPTGTAGQLFIVRAGYGVGAEGVAASLGVTLDISKLDANGDYQVLVSVIAPKLPGSYLEGEGFTPRGLVVSVSGTPTVCQAALDTLMFQPAPGFSGAVSFSFQLFNRADNVLLSSLITSLNVKSGSAMPTVTAPDSIDVILEQMTPAAGLQVGYTDSTTAASAIFSVVVATSHTGAASFAAAAGGVSYTPVQGTEAPSHQLVGTLASLNAALQSLHVKFTFSTNSAQRNYAPDPYTIHVHMTDMTVGSDGHRANATRTISANIVCSASSVPHTKVVEARVDPTGNAIVATLDLPVSDNFLATPVFDCEQFLDFNSAKVMGVGAVCHWVSTVAFKINMGMGASFSPSEHQLTIQNGKLQRCYDGSNASPSQTFAVLPPLVAIVPSVFISGPKTTSLCNPLLLQGITSMIGGRTPVYEWVLPRNLNPAHMPAKLDERNLEVDPQAFNDGGDFTFTLTVRNYLGQKSAVVRKTVTATNLPVPLIFPTSLTEVSVTSAKSIRIYNSVTVNPCFNEPLKPMLFSWKLTPALPAGHSVVLNTANLVIPPNVLLPGQTYKAVLRVAVATNPNELYSEIDYMINVRPSELSAYIAGGEWRKVRVDAAEWTMDASRSTDPDARSVFVMKAAQTAAGGTFDAAIAATYAADQYSYSWTCTTATGSKCFNSLTGSLLPLAQSPVITLPQHALPIGLYTFTLTYTHEPSKRTSTQTALIAIREGVNPTAWGPAGTVDILLDSMDQVVSPSGKVRLTASLPVYYADSTEDLVYQWEVLGGARDSGITTATLENNPNVQGFGTSVLVLNAGCTEGFFVPGTDYHFKVTVFHRDDSQAVADAGQALVYVRVNAPPSCDSFLTSALTLSGGGEEGVAFNSTFVVQALNCYDSDAQPTDLLHYTFFRLDEEGHRFNLLPMSHSPLGRVPLLPTGNAGNNNLLTLGVIVSDDDGGRQEYTREVRIVPNEVLRGTAQKPVASPLQALRNMYSQTWAANAAITGDVEMLLVIEAAILTEVNSLAAARAPTGADLKALLEFKKLLLSDIARISDILPSMQVLQATVEMVHDLMHTDQDIMARTLDFIAARAPQEGGASVEQELVDGYVRTVKGALDFIVQATGAVNTGAGARRLFALDTLEMGVAEGTPTASNPAAIVASALATLNLLAQDASTHSLQVAQETYPITMANSKGLTGAIGRGAAGRAANASTTDGYGVLAAPGSFANLAPGSFFDVSVFGISPVPFIGLASPSDVSSIVSGGASVAAFLPAYLQDSTPVTSFPEGELSVAIPISLALESCVQGDYTAPTTDKKASGNVYGNMCQLGCKVWNGQEFTTTGTSIVSLHPLSRKAVCSVTQPGVAVAFVTRLSEPYIPPPEDVDTVETNTPTTQENDLPFGVVRASLILQPAPVIYDLNAFKAQFVADMSSLMGIPENRVVVRAVSTTGTATTVIWDFLPANEQSSEASQSVYDRLIEIEDQTFKSLNVMATTVPPSISQLCLDKTYRRVCDSEESLWSKMEVPLIISICCLVFLCFLACCIYACVRIRRSSRANAADLKMHDPALAGAEPIPAKKFVYTAPNSESNSSKEDQPSEVTIMAKGLEFEPSNSGNAVAAPSLAGGAEAEGASKNRLSAKFPKKDGAAALAAGAAGAGAAAAVAGAGAAKEESKSSSHHFYYVDEKVAPGGGLTPSHGNSRRNSRSGGESGIAFSLNGGNTNELSNSGAGVHSRNASQSGSGGGSQSQPSSPVSDQRRRRGSAPGAAPIPEEAGDKAALPVVRPGQK